MNIKLILFFQIVAISFAQISSQTYVLYGGFSSTIELSSNDDFLLRGSFWAYHTENGILQSSSYHVIPFPSSIFSMDIDQSKSDEVLPLEFALSQNYPNPFNPITTIRYDLPEQAFVTLVVYDLLGREVVRLVNEQMEAGYQQAMWNGRDSRGKEVPTGIYIARMDGGDYTKSIKMLLMK